MAISTLQQDINQGHVAFMQRMLGLPEDGEIPEHVLNEYMIAKRMGDRISLTLSDNHLLMILMVAKAYDKPPEVQGPSVAELFRQKKISVDDTIQVKFRNKWRSAVILDVSPDDRCLVRFPGGAEEYKIDPDKVRIKE